MRTPEENKELCRSFMQEVFNKRDLDRAEDTLTDDFIEHNPFLPDMPHDKKGALETFRMMFDAIPDLKAEIIQLIASGDKVAIHSRISGTDSGTGLGAMMGAGPTGKSFSAEGIDVVTINDEGKFSEHYGLTDAMGMMGQLGLLPPPPGTEHEH